MAKNRDNQTAKNDAIRAVPDDSATSDPYSVFAGAPTIAVMPPPPDSATVITPVPDGGPTGVFYPPHEPPQDLLRTLPDQVPDSVRGLYSGHEPLRPVVRP